MTAGEALLVAEHLSHTYPNGNGGLPALRDVSLTVAREGFVSVVGPSGCGKTTLLRLISGLLIPTAGRIAFEGAPLRRPRRRIGFVFQEANLMPWRSTRQNVRLPLEIQGAIGGEERSRVEDMIRLVGLEGFEESLPRDLSGGMAQRVALARALVHQPDLLLLDEPFGSLDALTRERMSTELMRIWRHSQVTVLMVTHSIADAVLLSDRVVVLSDRPGTVVLDLPVNLPRPRQLDMVYTQQFGALADQVRSAIGANRATGKPKLS